MYASSGNIHKVSCFMYNKGFVITSRAKTEINKEKVRDWDVNVYMRCGTPRKPNTGFTLLGNHQLVTSLIIILILKKSVKRKYMKMAKLIISYGFYVFCKDPNFIIRVFSEKPF